MDEDDSLRLIIAAIKEKIIPSINKQKEELEEEATKFTYNQGETMKQFSQRCEELRSQLIMENRRLGIDEEKFMDLVLQALDEHPLSNALNTIFIGSEFAGYERVKKLLNTATFRA